MRIQIKLADNQTLQVDTLRENYYPSDLNKTSIHGSQLSLISDSPTNLGDIDKYTKMFTPASLATITATTDGNVTAAFKGYTKIANLNFSLLPNTYHYEFIFEKEEATQPI